MVETASRSTTIAAEDLAPRDEAGTAPEDRRFRPDIQGLRAVAVLLVVLYHAGFPGLNGGYVGVDVFFVISGFVITGLLLRERAARGRTSLAHFYGRRARRIIPAATLVIVVVVLATYRVLGPVTGNQTAIDSRWTAVFLANFHFASLGSNYLTAGLPPSPLLNFWSLAVEEQFYLVYPTLFLLVAVLGVRRWSMRARLMVALGAVIGASFAWSVVQTASNAQTAYYSPLTRAWELALGALVAVAAPWLMRVPQRLAAWATWLGLVAIAVSAFWFDAQTPFPGAWAAVPVVGAALVIAGGTPVPPRGTEVLLRRPPFQWLGTLSYSLYLWHWPILILAAESMGKSSLPFAQSLPWVGVAIGAAVVTYRFMENPVRHARVIARSPLGSIGLGAVLIGVTLIVATVAIDIHGTSGTTDSSNPETIPILSPQQVHRLVAASSSIQAVPPNISPPLSWAFFDRLIPGTWTGCEVTAAQITEPSCTFGAPNGRRTMVIYGDSHAEMWATALNDIAVADGWKLVTFVKPGCPAVDLPVSNPPGYGVPGDPFPACDQWHRYVTDRINQLRPNMLIVTQAVWGHPPGWQMYSPAQWQAGLERTFNQITVPTTEKVVIGDISTLSQPGPPCLSMHPDDAQSCAAPAQDNLTPYRQAEARAAVVAVAHYVDTIPWFCTRTCSAVIGHFDVYADEQHVTNHYARALEGVLATSLGLPAPTRRLAPSPDPLTSILRPTSGAVLSGIQIVYATAVDNVSIRKVEFRITGGTRRDAAIGAATLSLTGASFDGAIVHWNTKSVPNGRYAVQSVLYDAAGKVGRSRAVSVVVAN
jgi:peptidoglycan/LPS O-acetylase OafA/YrhL